MKTGLKTNGSRSTANRHNWTATAKMGFCSFCCDGAGSFSSGVPGQAAKATRGPPQTMDSLKGRIQELHSQVKSIAKNSLVLFGSYSGAVLILFTVARYPGIAKKLLLVGSAEF